MKCQHTFGTLLLCVALLGAPLTTVYAQPIINGGFESGLAGWTRLDQIGSDGTFFAQAGNQSPVNGFAVPVPPEGAGAAMTDAQAGGTHILYQDIFIPNSVPLATIEFSLFLQNGANAYFNPANLDWAATNQNGNLILNQQARVDLMTTTADPFSVGAGDVLQNLFATSATTPLITGYDAYSIDVTAVLQAHAGQTVRLRFAEVDNVFFLNLGVDNVRVNIVPEPATCLLALGAVAWLNRRRILRR